jgi:hypothetical protein
MTIARMLALPSIPIPPVCLPPSTLGEKEGGAIAEFGAQ